VSFLETASVLEGVGVSAYLGAAASISTAAYLTAAGSILTVEARHNAYIRAALGERPFAQPFDTPLDYNEVYTLASPFIVDCPSTNPPFLPVEAFPALSVTGQAPIRTGSTIILSTDNKLSTRAVRRSARVGPGSGRNGGGNGGRNGGLNNGRNGGLNNGRNGNGQGVGGLLNGNLPDGTLPDENLPAGNLPDGSLCNGRCAVSTFHAAWATVKGPIFTEALVHSNGKSFEVVVPAGVHGQSYVVLTSSGTTVSDSTIVAGPALVEVAGSAGDP
jgi:hypothetical protein